MRGEVLASLAGATVGYFAGIKENLEAQSQIYLGNELRNTQLFFHNDPVRATVANVILYAIIFACCYNIAKNTGQIVQYAHLYELRRKRSNRIDRQ